jgi:hypothetical protein
MSKKRALRPEKTVVASMLDPDTILVASESATKAPLGPVERLLVSKMDGHRTLADLAGLAELSTLETKTVLGRLVQLGLARIEQEVSLDEGWDQGPPEPARPASENPTRPLPIEED